MKTILLTLVLAFSIPATAQYNWEQSNTGIGNNFFNYGFVAYGDTVYASGTDVFGGKQKEAVYKSVNRGASWQLASMATSFPDTSMLRIIYHGGSYLLAIHFNGSNFARWGLRTSYDGGNTWVKDFTGIDTATEYLTSVIKLDNGTLLASGGYVAGGFLFFTSTDNGKTWIKRATPSGIGVTYVLNLHKNGNRLYATTYTNMYHRLYVSDDDGYNWSALNYSGISPSFFPKCIITNDNKNIYAIGELQHQMKIYFTSDSGVQWTNYTYSPVGVNYSGVDAAMRVGDIILVSLGGYVNNSSKIFRNNPLSLSASITENPLCSVYPNPAVNSISVENAPEGTAFELYTLLGERIAAIQNGKSIDVSMLASGVYMLKVTDGEKTYTTRFVKE